MNDIQRVIIIRMFAQHMHRACDTNTKSAHPIHATPIRTNSHNSDTDANHIKIVDYDSHVEQCLQFVVLFHSYAVVRPTLCRDIVVSRTNDDVEYDVLEPGLNSIRRMRTITDTRVCILCRHKHLTMGCIDDVAYRTQTCQCALAIERPITSVDDILEKTYRLRTTMLVRYYLLANESRNRQTPTCDEDSCMRHHSIFRNTITHYMTVLYSIPL